MGVKKKNEKGETNNSGSSDEIATLLHSKFKMTMPHIIHELIRSGGQRNHLSQRRGKRRRERRRSTNWTRGMQSQPWVNALDVEQMAAIGQQP